MTFERKKDYNQWIKNQELMQARQAAADAWEKRDYAKMVKLFEPIANELTPSECKKLEYSRKHLWVIDRKHQATPITLLDFDRRIDFKSWKRGHPLARK